MSAPGVQGNATSQTSGTTPEAEVEELIPGIPNEVTVGQITTKMSMKDVDTLASVSRAWCHAIRSRKVHAARVRSGSLEWLYIFDDSDEEHVLALKVAFFTQSGDDAKPSLTLPPLTSEYYARQVTAVESPRSGSTADGGRWGTPRHIATVHRVTLDGKVYVLWGLDGKVNVLDIAGHRQWKQCADMLKPRKELGCGVIAGKLYVHGGAVDYESACGAEVYNPQDNTWTPIRSIVSLQCSRHCGSGRTRKEVFWNVGADGMRYRSPLTNDDPLEVYDPVKDEWRVVEPVGKHKERMFLAGGEFYSMSPLGIHIYDFHENSWGNLHPFLFVGIASVDPVEISPAAILVDGELLAIVDWCSAGRYGSCLVLSRGLSSGNKEIVWHKPNYSKQNDPNRCVVHIDSFFFSI